jgi:hypothetical protein
MHCHIGMLEDTDKHCKMFVISSYTRGLKNKGFKNNTNKYNTSECLVSLYFEKKCQNFSSKISN